MILHAPLRDRDVRAVLLAELSQRHADDGSLILNELGLRQGETRVDVAVVNGEISGYEIKSAADTLARFPHQQALYSEVLDRAWLVTTSERIEQLKSTLPEWWGLIATSEREDVDGVQLDTVREATRNTDQNPLAIVQLLWRDEALGLLAAIGAEKGIMSKPRAVLWNRLTETYALDDLCAAVRTTLKARANWRFGPPRSLGGAKYPVGAKFLACLVPAPLRHTRACTDPQD